MSEGSNSLQAMTKALTRASQISKKKNYNFTFCFQMEEKKVLLRLFGYQ